MLRLINAQLVNGQLSSIDIKDGLFTTITKQSHPIQSDSHGVTRVNDFATVKEFESGVIDIEQALVVPGLLDIHIHSRDPGFPHKETWQSLADAAFKGGVTWVGDMPNTVPPVLHKTDIIEKAKKAQSTGIGFGFYLGCSPRNLDELAPLLEDPSLPLCGLKVYYGQSTGEMMFANLDLLHKKLPQDLQKIISFHSEDQCIIEKNLDSYKKEIFPAQDHLSYQVHSEIRNSESAVSSTRKILEWAKKRKRRIHIAHVSTPEELQLIIEFKKQGLGVTSEVAPHHLLLSTVDYIRLGGFLKVNPPVRSKKEVDKLRELVAQGFCDVFATDHAPHTIEEKKQPYPYCPSGLPSIEYFLPLIFTLSKVLGCSHEMVIDMATKNPAKILGFGNMGDIRPGSVANFVVFEQKPTVIEQQDVISKCGWTPYDGMEVVGRIKATWNHGKRVY